MKVGIVTLGSRGDVQPYVALARGLMAAGHEVTIGAEPPYEDLVTRHSIPYVALGDRADTVESFERFARLQHETGRRAYKIIREANSWILDLLTDQMSSCEQVAEGADVLVEGTMSMITPHVAERYGQPFVRAYLRPETRTRAYRRPDLVYPDDSRFGARNRGSYTLPWIAVWGTVRKPVNDWRSERGLAPFGSTNLLDNPTRHHHYRHRFPVLNGYSEKVAPREDDYPAWHHHTGFWELDQAAGYEPPADLAAWLDGGPPPICIGFGSIPVLDPDRLWPAILGAVDQTQQRAIVLTGWGGLDRRVDGEGAVGRDRRRPSDDVFITEAVPHDWLYPRCSMAIHHGGAGATAASMTAGVPTVIIPFLWDQLFWGRRAHALGVGPLPIEQPALTAEALADAIRAAGTGEVVRRAAALGDELRAEAGVARAIDLLEQTATAGRRACLV